MKTAPTMSRPTALKKLRNLRIREPFSAMRAKKFGRWKSQRVVEMKAYFIGSGIGSSGGRGFPLRDAGERRRHHDLRGESSLGGSLDGVRLPDGSYSLRGGRMLTTDHYECTWDLLSTIPSVDAPGQTIRDETHRVQQEIRRQLAGSARRLQPPHLDVQLDGLQHARPARVGAADRGFRGKSSASAASPIGFRQPFFNTNFWLCGRPPSPSSPGTARSSSSATCIAS